MFNRNWTIFFLDLDLYVFLFASRNERKKKREENLCAPVETIFTSSQSRAEIKKLPFTSPFISIEILHHYHIQLFTRYRARFHASNHISFVEKKSISWELERFKVFLILIECNRVSKIHSRLSWWGCGSEGTGWSALEKDGDSGRIKNYFVLYTTISRKLGVVS